MNPTDFQRVAIVGAGAIGGWLGVRLAQAGCELSALARGETLAALRRDGWRLQSGEQEVRVPVQASDRAVDLGVQDLVIVALKAPALPALAPALAPLIGRHTVVLTAMNGVPWWFCEGLTGELAQARLSSVDPHGAIAQAIPARHVIGGVVHASCSVQAPGVVRHHFGKGLIVGEPRGQNSERAQALAALLCLAGLEATVSPQIQRDVWFKLWGNMSVNPVSALTGATADRLLADPLVRDFMSRTMLEAKAIGERIGIPIDQQPEDRHAVTAKLGAIRTSMLQDVQARRPVELDALVGAVRELGQRVQVPTPNLDALFGLARLQARTLGLYPDAAPG